MNKYNKSIENIKAVLLALVLLSIFVIVFRVIPGNVNNAFKLANHEEIKRGERDDFLNEVNKQKNEIGNLRDPFQKEKRFIDDNDLAIKGERVFYLRGITDIEPESINIRFKPDDFNTNFIKHGEDISL